MVYDEGLAYRISEILQDRPDVVVIEKKMFGGIAYMIHGNMRCGVIKDDLMVRVGKDRYEKLLAHEFAREMDFTGRPLKGLVLVASEGIAEDEDLQFWVDIGLRYASSLPPK